MKKLSSLFYSKINLGLAIASTLITFSYLFIVMMSKAKSFEVPNGTIFLGLSFGFSQDMIMEFFSLRTPAMLEAYKEFNTITDTIYPILYGLQYIFWISYLYKPFVFKFKWFNLLGILPCILDLFENIQLVALTNQYLDNKFISESAVHLASIFSILKWVTSLIIFVIIFAGAALRIKRYFESKKIIL